MGRWRRGATAIAVIATATLALAGCAGSDHGGADPGLQGQWVLASAHDDGGTIDLFNQSISLTIAGDQTTAGRSTCSDYTARFLGTRSSLWVTVNLPSHIDCGSVTQQQIEQRYIAALSQVSAATVSGGQMELTAPGGIRLDYSRALFIPMTFIVGRSWELNTAASLPLESTETTDVQPSQGAVVTFARNGKLTAVTNCSSLSARFAENAGEVVATDVKVTTEPHCADDYDGADYVIRVIDSGFRFISAAGQLTLISPRAELQLGFVGGEPTAG